jgi:NTP pyrophosphatase (non-canonical NTP hydrolase)
MTNVPHNAAKALEQGSDTLRVATNEIFKAYIKALNKHGPLPQGDFKRMSILLEEIGEAAKALNEHKFKGKSVEHVITELAHAGATILTFLEELCKGRR